MTDFRRTLLWVVFMMSLLLLWDGWNQHNGKPSMFGTPQPARPAAATASSAPGGVSPAVAVIKEGATTGAESAASISPSEQVVVTTDVMKATFDSRGGSLVRLELLAYVATEDHQRHVLVFEQSDDRSYAAQTGLIAQRPDAKMPNHLSAMRWVPGATALAAQDRDLTVRFESTDDNGLRLIKTYTLARGSYAIGVRHDVINASTEPTVAQLYLQLVRDGNAPRGESSFYFTFTGPAVYTEEKKFQKVAFKDIEKGKVDHAVSANEGWVAMVQHYFASAWLVPAGAAREFRTAKVADNLYSVAMVLPLGDIAPGATKTLDATLFAGPQEENKLAALAPGLELVKDYGFLTILAKPLFWLLSRLHQMLGNWGWSIVALVVLLKIAFYWLNAQAYQSMAKMKAVGPRITDLRERFKDKPQLMQQEMMRIYREEKINPLGGCLPILVQMPFFLALYWVLLSSVEMRNAPWIGWVTDLAAKDPWFILPVLMTASSLFQVWLNPKPTDAMQARMMWLMPLVFGIMFFFFPAGLVLYWLTNNILSIAQQWVINRRLGLNK